MLNIIFEGIKYAKDKILPSFFVFFISFYKLELYNIGYSHIDLLIIFAWILLTFLPDKIYKNGIKTSFFF